jgi:predicted RNA binding protein YcfA (HicA-like mRNA interferase family)
LALPGLDQSASTRHTPVMPRKIRELIRDLEHAGFLLIKGRGKGDHRKFKHPKVARFVILDGKDGQDAHHYQEKQIKQRIEESKS